MNEKSANIVAKSFAVTACNGSATHVEAYPIESFTNLYCTKPCLLASGRSVVVNLILSRVQGARATYPTLNEPLLYSLRPLVVQDRTLNLEANSHRTKRASLLLPFLTGRLFICYLKCTQSTVVVFI
jgi:hypothetical protein